MISPPGTSTRPTSMMVDANIPEAEDDFNTDLNSEMIKVPDSSLDNHNNNNLPTQFVSREHLCRRKSKSISNFGDQDLSKR